MSLCLLLRTPDGGALMAADTAVSTVYEGQPYRVQNESDDEKVIIHLGHMIFCSGNLERCRALRQFIRSLDAINYESIRNFARVLWGEELSDDSTGILICQPDNKLVGMLSAQSFEITELPQNKNGLDIQALGFKMEEAYTIACASVEQSDDWRIPVLDTYRLVACEEVGGIIHIFTRAGLSAEIETASIALLEPSNIRRGVFVALTQPFEARHSIVQAKQFLDSRGNDMFKSDGKIKSDYLDLGKIQLDGATGDITMSGNINMGGNISIGGNIDFSRAGAITWGSKTPVKYQFSINGTSGWHDTMQATDKYRRDSLDGGTTWGAGYQFKGEDGKPGANGDDADVTFLNIKTALQKAASTQTTFITADSAGSPNIYGGNIYGANIYAGRGEDSYACMNGTGFDVFVENVSQPKIRLYADTDSSPTIQLGAGDGNARNIFRIIKNPEGAMLIYQPSSGLSSGFSFHDGVITPMGELDVTAVLA